MIYWFFTWILLISAPILAFFYLKSKAIGAYHDFFDAPDKETPSPFGAILDSAAQLFAARLMQSLRAQLANMNSITTRQTNAVRGDALLGDLANSGIGGALASIPGVEKMIRKNPLLGLAAQFVVGKMAIGQTPKQPEPQGAGAGFSGNGHGLVDPRGTTL
jgi:hypothetical protein